MARAGDIPTHQASIRVPTAAAQGRPMEADRSGLALADLGDTMQRVAEAEIARRQKADVANAKLRYAERLDGIDAELEANPNHREHSGAFESRAMAARDELAKGLTGDAAADFERYARGADIAMRPGVRARARRLETDENRAALSQRLAGLSEQLGDARGAARTALLDLADSAIRDMAEGGWISREAAVQLQRDFRVGAAETRAAALIEADPRAALNALQPVTSVSDRLLQVLIQRESGGDPNAVSPAGAQGLAQAMPATAKNPGYGVAPLKDPFDPDQARRFAKDYLGAMLNEFDGDLEAALIAYNAGPANAQKWLEAGRDYGALPKPEETMPYVSDIMGALGREIVPDLPDKARRRLRGQARTAVAALDREAKAAQKIRERTLQDAIGDIVDLTEDGYAPAPELIEQTRALAAETGNAKLSDELELAEDMAVVIAGVQTQAPTDAKAALTELETAMAKGATPRQQAVAKGMQAAIDRLEKGLEADPLGFANQAGVVELEPLPLDQDRDSLVAGFAGRRDQALSVKRRYGIPLRVFTPEETARMAAAMDDASPGRRADMAAAIVEGFGRDAQAAFAELGQAAPVMAHVGGLSLMGPRQNAAAQEALAGLDMTPEEAKAVPGEATDFDPVFAEELGGAIPPEFAAEVRAIRATAEHIYRVRARRAGVTAFDAAIYRNAVSAALGSEIGSYRGLPVILPDGMNDRTFGRVIQGLDTRALNDWSAGARPVYGDGSAAKPSAFRRAYFVSVGPGRYRVSVSDPRVRPEYLVDAESGGFYVIDLNGRQPRLQPGRRTTGDRAE